MIGTRSTYRSASIASGGASAAAGRPTSAASRAARPASWKRAAPRARSRAISPRRCSVSSVATSSRAYPPSTTTSRIGVTRLDRPTRSARLSRSTNRSSRVVTSAEEPSPMSSGSCSVAYPAARRSGASRVGSTAARSGSISQAAEALVA